MPVTKDRTDTAYYAPLAQLVPNLGQTELILGLVHPNDLEGTRERIRVARTVVPFFGVSTECGLGRMLEQEMNSVLDIALAVSDPVIS